MLKPKEIIKKVLVSRAEKKYQNMLKPQVPDFDSWIREKESGLSRFDMSIDTGDHAKEDGDLALNRDLEAVYEAYVEGNSIRIVPYSKVKEGYSLKTCIEDIIVFVNGELTDRALPLITRYFTANPDKNIVYGDEDIADLNRESGDKYGKTIPGSRRDPYFKPDWSPNKFMSHFYFCNIVAVRRSAFREHVWDEKMSGAQAIYRTCLRYMLVSEYNLLNTVGHIDEILVHASEYSNNKITDDIIKKIAPKMNVELQKSDNSDISIIICTKDHPDLLKTCLDSVMENNQSEYQLDIIVIDNGSKKTNRSIYEELSLEYHYHYEYKKREFNYSDMCNVGVMLSKAPVILLLNDDVELKSKGALRALYEQTRLRFVGAVGIKLLYPDNNRIQHAGITNNRIGPVHKLQFSPDDVEYAHGFNRYVQNVLAVTGACLMVRKELYTALSGLNDELKVAFNDVEFCFRLYEAGYKNVVCNQVYATHHESITRGKDNDAESLKRLQSEKQKLYDLHTALRARDPYYNKYLLSDCLDQRIVPACEYEYSKAVVIANTITSKNFKRCRKDECLKVTAEYVGKLCDYTYDAATSGDDYYIQGYSFVTFSDNACYKKYLILASADLDLLIPFKGCYRGDVKAAMPDQINTELCGFALRIPSEKLPEGVYSIGVLVENMCAREQIFNMSNRNLIIRKE